MKKMLKPLIFVFAAGLSSLALADNVAIPVGQQGADQAIARPTTGLSMAQVSSQFGEPERKIPAVGNPPISRWIYHTYTVYFEHDRVIHSVLHPNP